MYQKIIKSGKTILHLKLTINIEYVHFNYANRKILRILYFFIKYSRM